MRLRPSSASVWAGPCQASVRLSEGVPDIETNNDVREEGTACHWVAQTLWQPGAACKPGDVAPNGVTVTDEMIEAATSYLERLSSRGIPVSQIFIEVPLLASAIHAECGGTPDAVSIDWVNRIVYIDDLKFGYRFVEVFGNWQLLIYAIAAAARLPASWLEARDWRFVLTIHQPRAFTREGPVRSWEVSQDGLVEYLRHLQAKAEIAMRPDTVPVGGSHCEDCRARLRCRASQAIVASASEQAGGHLPNDLTFEQADRELARLRQVQAVLDGYVVALTAQIRSGLYSGSRSRYFEIVHEASRDQWKDEESRQTAISLANIYKVDIRKTDETLTPTQAKKLLPKGVLDSLTHRPSGGAKLTPISAVKVQKALSK